MAFTLAVSINSICARSAHVYGCVLYDCDGAVMLQRGFGEEIR